MKLKRLIRRLRKPFVKEKMKMADHMEICFQRGNKKWRQAK